MLAKPTKGGRVLRALSTSCRPVGLTEDEIVTMAEVPKSANVEGPLANKLLAILDVEACEYSCPSTE